MSTETKEAKEAIGNIVISILIFAYGLAVRSYIFYLFYTWFVTPVIQFVPNINYWQALGLTMFIRCISFNTPVLEKTKDDDIDYSRVIVLPWIVLFLGWLLHLII